MRRVVGIVAVRRSLRIVLVVVAVVLVGGAVVGIRVGGVVIVVRLVHIVGGRGLVGVESVMRIVRRRVNVGGVAVVVGYRRGSRAIVRIVVDVGGPVRSASGPGAIG